METRNLVISIIISGGIFLVLGQENNTTATDTPTNSQNSTRHLIIPVDDDTFQTEHGPNHFSSAYVVQAELAIRQLPDDERISEIEERLSWIVLSAFELSTSRHLRQNVQGSIPVNKTNNPFAVQVIGVHSVHGIVRIDFVVYFEEKLVDAQVVVDDVSMLTLSQVSAILHYPVISIKSESDIKKTEESRWWVIAIIIGSGLLVVIFGWMLLFIYYNTCGRPLPKYSPTLIEEKTVTNIDQNVQTDTLEIGLTKGDYEKPYPRPVDLEVVHESIIVQEPRVVEPEITVKESPRVAVPTTVSDVTDSPKTAQQGRLQLPIEKEKEPTSHSARSRSVTQRPKIPERPKSAIPHKRPIRTLEGDVIEELTPVRKPKLWWSPYMSGDEIAAVYSIGPGLNNHPTPKPASETGVIELSSSDLLRYL